MTRYVLLAYQEPLATGEDLMSHLGDLATGLVVATVLTLLSVVWFGWSRGFWWRTTVVSILNSWNWWRLAIPVLIVGYFVGYFPEESEDAGVRVALSASGTSLAIGALVLIVGGLFGDQLRKWARDPLEFLYRH